MSDTPRIEYSRQDDPLTWDLPNDAGAITFVGVEDAQKAQALFCEMQSEIKNYKERYETCLEQLAKEKDKSEAQFKKDQKERLRLHEAKLKAESQKEYLERELNAALIAAGCASKERGEWAAERESLTISQAAIKYAQSFVEAEDENRNDFNDRRISFVMREVAKVGSVLAVGESCVGGWIGRDQWSCRCGAKIPEQCKTETAKP